MKFCMLTTFFGTHRFGGDAVYVDRLCHALLRAGHEVHVIHGKDAFETVRGKEPLKAYVPPDGLHIHTIENRVKILPSLLNHQTGTMGINGRKIRQILKRHDFDVVHFHNVSLLGGPKIFEVKTKTEHAVKLASIHEFWFLCPLNLLWKFDQKICDKPECLICCLKAGRPPQLWRKTGMLKRSISSLDALLFPSRHTLRIHEQHGFEHPDMIHLPHFLPEDWFQKNSDNTAAPDPPVRPYFAMAGRLVREKGYQDVIAAMPRFPSIDLKIAGTGPFFEPLRRQARGMKNVLFLGQLTFSELEPFFRFARALIVPSLFYETFGYVVLEAFSTQTPVIAASRGALPELIQQANAGFSFKNQAQLVEAMDALANDRRLAKKLGKWAAEAVSTFWTEKIILEKYLSIIAEIRNEKYGR